MSLTNCVYFGEERVATLFWQSRLICKTVWRLSCLPAWGTMRALSGWGFFPGQEIRTLVQVGVLFTLKSRSDEWRTNP